MQLHIITICFMSFRYGAHFASDTLGIIYNNQLGDSFTVDSVEHKLSSSEENWPKPFARPLSGMAPNIILDDKGDVKMVSGAAGGAMIPAAVAWVCQTYLFIYSIAYSPIHSVIYLFIHSLIFAC